MRIDKALTAFYHLLTKKFISFFNYQDFFANYKVQSTSGSWPEETETVSVWTCVDNITHNKVIFFSIAMNTLRSSTDASMRTHFEHPWHISKCVLSFLVFFFSFFFTIQKVDKKRIENERAYEHISPRRSYLNQKCQGIAHSRHRCTDNRTTKPLWNITALKETAQRPHDQLPSCVVWYTLKGNVELQLIALKLQYFLEWVTRRWLTWITEEVFTL